jgi:hypothetical protein
MYSLFPARAKRLAAGFVLLGTLCVAQTFTGTILGHVEDSSGAVIPGAKVQVRELATNVERNGSTNELGYYEFPLLPPGTYQVMVEHPGFKRFSRSNLKLETGQRMEVTATMTPGELVETVEVTGESPLLQTTVSSVGQVIENKRVMEMPLSNRNLLQLVSLVSGVYDRGATAAPATTGSVAFGRWTSNGGMTNTNEFMLDGATAILANMNAASIIPTIDAIEEFKIHTNAMSAEFGRTGGAVINATYRSGTNTPHGTVYEFWKNRVLNANTWLNNSNGTTRDFLNIHTFGYSIGGPVVLPKVYDGRNRTFFFHNYEGYRDVLPSRQILTVPTQAEIGGNFSERRNQSGSLILIYDPLTTTAVPGQANRYTRQPFAGNIVPAARMDPVGKNLASYYPAPNTTPPDPYSNLRNYFAAPSGKNRQNEWSIKADHNLNQGQRLFVRYSESSQGGGAANLFGGAPECKNCLKPGNPAGAYSARGGGSDLFIYPKNAVVGYTHTLSPTTVLDMRYSVNRQLLSRLPQSSGFDITTLGYSQQLASLLWYPVYPTINVSDYECLGCRSNGDYLRRGDTTHAVQGSVTKMMGAHTIKAGGDFRLFRYADLQAYDINLTFSFNRAWTQQDPYAGNALAGWGLASLLLGTPASGSTRIPASVAVQFFYGSAYIQDDWRLSNRLTLNLGFRYDIETPYTERYNRTSSFDPSVRNSATARDPRALGGLQFMGKDISSRYRNEIDRNNVGPRVGLAYKFAPNFVLRAAYGIFYQPSLVYGYGQTQFGADGYDSTTPFVGTVDGGLTPSRYLRDPFPEGVVPPQGNALGADTLLGRSVSSQLRDTVIPYSQQYNAGLQYQIKSWLIDAGYVGSHTVKQPINLSMTQIDPRYMPLGNDLRRQVPNPYLGLVTAGSYANPTVAYGDLLKPFPHFGSVTNIFASIGDSNYQSMQARLERRFARGYSILAVYTWGKNIGNVGERYHVGNSIQNNYDLRSERALSPFDVAHRLVLSYLWELPFGKGKAFGGSLPKAADLLVSGWQVNGITTFQSGTPLSVGLYTSVTCCGAGQRPNSTGRPAKLPSSERTVDRWIDAGAFSQPDPYTFGNTSWMSPELRGPGTNSWTVSFFKNTPITERVQTQLRAEFFNFFNHPMWGAPGTSWGSPSYGRVFSKSGNRSGQLGLKVIF